LARSTNHETGDDKVVVVENQNSDDVKERKGGEYEVWHVDLLQGDCAGEGQQQFNRPTE
jgi:hypothetical protein